jgi:hypothetical protein
MTVVFFAFTFTTDRTIRMIGLGMASAIVIDALLVRTVLGPSVMHCLGKTNWYLPRALDRRLPHLSLEEREEVSQSDGEVEEIDEVMDKPTDLRIYSGLHANGTLPGASEGTMHESPLSRADQQIRNSKRSPSSIRDWI